jgi:diadenosine tetraphosphate (Ap4A) HIT family hydrolase
MKSFHQDALAVEQKVKELQERVGHLMIVILHHVTPKSEEDGEEAVERAVKRIEEDIKELLRCGLRIVVRNAC